VPESPRGAAPPPPRRRQPSGRGAQHPRRPTGPSRAERRAAGANRSRSLQVIAAAAVLALLVAAGFFFFRDGGGGEKTVKVKPRPKAEIGDVELVVGGVYNVNGGPPVPLPPEIQNSVMSTVHNYVQGALLDPVREGETAEAIGALFDGVTAPRLEGPDRAVLFEEGLPDLTGSFKPSALPVNLTALSDGAGNFVLVTASFVYSATVEAKQGEIVILRNTELTLVPDGGAWKITAYDVHLTRELPETEPTTTTAAA
jgi:hypothetical protein